MVEVAVDVAVAVAVVVAVAAAVVVAVVVAARCSLDGSGAHKWGTHTALLGHW
jgi:hypothetical protein